jgi:hypothetical protein
MDFIERIFGFSPDDGSGAFEVMLFAVPILILIVFAVRLRLQRQGNSVRKF